MLIISFEEILCFCSVYRHLYNISAFKALHLFMDWNLDPNSDKRVLPLPTHNFANEQAEFSPITFGFNALIYFLRGPQEPCNKMR